MDRGVHEWTLKIERDVDGTWVGVSSPDLTLGRDTTPQSIDPSNSKVWWWKSAGFTWQNHPHSDRPRNADQAFRRGQVIKLRMDTKRLDHHSYFPLDKFGHLDELFALVAPQDISATTSAL